MLDVKDKEGEQIYIEDVGIYTNPDTLEEVEAIVIAIFSEEEVQLCPIGEGMAFTCNPEMFEVKESFVQKALAMTDDETFNQVMTRARGAYESLIKSKPAKKAKAKKAPKVVRPPLDL